MSDNFVESLQPGVRETFDGLVCSIVQTHGQSPKMMELVGGLRTIAINPDDLKVDDLRQYATKNNLVIG